MASAEPEHRQLLLKLVTVVAGESRELSMVALTELTAMVIAVSADTPERADRLVDLMAAEVKRNARENWGVSRRMRAQSHAGGRA